MSNKENTTHPFASLSRTMQDCLIKTAGVREVKAAPMPNY
jgi:hypothetical protein